jgi:hypothetical protein
VNYSSELLESAEGAHRDTSVECTRSTASEQVKKRTLRDSSEVVM